MEKMIHLLAGEYEISEEQINLLELRDSYSGLAEHEVRRYKQDVLDRMNWEQFCTKGIQKGYDMIQREVDKFIPDIIKAGFYDVTNETIYNQFYEEIFSQWVNVEEGVKEIKQYCGEQYEQLAFARKLRKVGRDRIVGGGIGVKGAFSGIATAETINFATGAAHSVANMIGNARTSAQISKSCEKNYKSAQFQGQIIQCLLHCLCNIWLIEATYNPEKYDILPEDYNKSERILNNISMISSDKRMVAYDEALLLSPLNINWYYSLFKTKTCDFETVKRISEELKTPYTFKMGKKAYYRDFCIAQKRCVKDYYSARQVKEAIKSEKDRIHLDGLRTDEENEILKIINDIEAQALTVDGIKYKDLETAEEVKKQKQIARQIMSDLYDKSEDELFQIQKELQEINKKYPGYITSEIREFREFYNKYIEDNLTYFGYAYNTSKELEEAKEFVTYIKAKISDCKAASEINAIIKEIENVKIKGRFAETLIKQANEKREKLINKVNGDKIDEYVLDTYGIVNTDDLSPANVEKLTIIYTDVQNKFKKGVVDSSWDKAYKISCTLKKAEEYKALAVSKKENVFFEILIAALKTVGLLCICVVALFIFAFFCKRIIWVVIFEGIVLIICISNIKDAWEDVSHAAWKNREIDKARKSIK